MKAIYRGKLYTIVDDCTNMVDLVSMDDDTKLSVLWSDPSLILDPTDDEINNILPDYEEVKTAPSEKLAEGFDGRMKIAVPLDQIIGCNVHGRLTHVLHLLKTNHHADAAREIHRLLAFFPKPL